MFVVVLVFFFFWSFWSTVEPWLSATSVLRKTKLMQTDVLTFILFPFHTVIRNYSLEHLIFRFFMFYKYLFCVTNYKLQINMQQKASFLNKNPPAPQKSRCHKKKYYPSALYLPTTASFLWPKGGHVERFAYSYTGNKQVCLWQVL